MPARKRTNLFALRASFRGVSGYGRFRDSRNRGQGPQANRQTKKVYSRMSLLSPARNRLRSSRRQSPAQGNLRRFGPGRSAVGQISLHEADESAPGRFAHPRLRLGARHADRRAEGHGSDIRPRLRSDSRQKPRRKTMARGRDPPGTFSP